MKKLIDSGNLNKRFFSSYEDLSKRCLPIKFFLAENDPGTEMFEHYFLGKYLNDDRTEGGNRNQVDVNVINEANHIYTYEESQSALIKGITSWALEHFQ